MDEADITICTSQPKQVIPTA